MNWIIKFLNQYGLYTRKQYLNLLDEKINYVSYAAELEYAVCGMSDPKRPIVVFGSHVYIKNIELQFMQQIIVSPAAHSVQIEQVYCQAASNGN